MSLWDSVRDSLQKTAEKAGTAAKIGAQKTKLNAETLMVDREISQRKQLFGVTLYDHVAPLSSTPDFYASNDKQTETLRPFLLTAQREIAALEIRKTNIKEQQAQAEVTRKSAFPVPAQTFGGKVFNAGKSATLAAGEAKLMTDKAAVETLIRGHKQDFGEQLFERLVELEDKDGWLPTDRDFRAIYDQTRRDVEKLLGKRAAKELELKALDDPNANPTPNGTEPTVYATPTVPPTSTPTQSSSSMSTGTGMFGSSTPAATTAAASTVAKVAGSYRSTQTAVAAKIAAASMAHSFSSNSATSAVSSQAPSYSHHQQHQQGNATVDPFATSTAPSTTSTLGFPNATNYGAPPATSTDPFAGASGFTTSTSLAPTTNSFRGSMRSGTDASQALDNSFGVGGNTTTTTYDPFASAPAPTHGSFTTSTTSPADPFAGLSSSGNTAAPTSASADPFAGTIFAGTTSTRSNTAPHYTSR